MEEKKHKIKIFFKRRKEHGIQIIKHVNKKLQKDYKMWKKKNIK